MTTDPAARAAAGGDSTLIGHIVFHKGIREHEGIPGPLSGPHVVGRSYTNIAGLRAEGALRKGAVRYTFSPDPEADLFEEIVAKVSHDTVTMILTPHVAGTQILLSGRIRTDTVRGTWTFPAHHSRKQSHGRFVMWKVQPDSLLDSALIRSRRATRR